MDHRGESVQKENFLTDAENTTSTLRGVKQTRNFCVIWRDPNDIV